MPNPIIDGVTIGGTTYDLKDPNLTEEVTDLKSAIDEIEVTLTFDNLPTQSSEKLVKSGGIYSSVLNESNRAMTAEGLKVNKPIVSPNGTNGQVLKTNGDGTTEWVNVGSPSDSQVGEAVSAWLEYHPEATTTVQDGSLTAAKFSEALGMKTFNRYVIPQMYGALANGEHDDTEAIQTAIGVAAQNGGGVYLPKGTYLVTEMLLLNDYSDFVMDSQALIKAGASMNYVIELKVRVSYLIQRPHAVNLNVDGNNIATNGIFVKGIVHAGTTCVDGVSVKNCIKNGIVFNGCEGGVFMSVRSYDNGADGIRLEGCNNAKFINLSSMSNDGDGIVVANGTGATPTSGGCYIFAIHAEQNEGYGIKAESGLTTFYSGWLEGNKSTALYIASDKKCNVYGLRVVHAESEEWCEIHSDYATIRDCEVQVGGNTHFDPLVDANYCVVENICRAVQSGTIATGGILAERLFTNIIQNGDMQGAESAGAFGVFYASKEYQNTDVVETGKTYSMKCVSAAGGFAIRKDNLSGWQVGSLYKITFRVYLDGDDCTMRITAADQTLSNTQYSNIVDVKKGQWNEVTGYFYPRTNGEIKLVATTLTSSSTGAIFYVSEFFCQQCVDKKKISNKRIGNDKVYLTIEPYIMS